MGAGGKIISNLNLQKAYRGSGAAPHLTVDATRGPLALQDNAVAQEVAVVRTSAGTPVIRMTASAAVNVAALRVESTTQGLGIPGMTEVQRDAIPTGAGDAGLLIFNTDTAQTNQWTGAAWTVPGGGLTTLQGAYDNDPTGAQIVLDNVPNPFSVQAAVAGTVIEWLDVGGNPILRVTADPDTIVAEAAVTINDPFLNAGSSNSIVLSDTFTTGAGFIGGPILSNGTVTYNNAVFIWALLQESKIYAAAAGPGFAAFTLFNALNIIRNSGNFDLVQAIVLNVGTTHERVTAGTSNVIQTIGVSFAAQTRATVAGAVLTRTTGMTGLAMSPTMSTVAGSTINMGIIRGMLCNAPVAGLFQPTLGTENLTAYYGVDFTNITFPTSGDKVVIRSAMTDAADRFFLQNNGGARSDFGGGLLLDCSNVEILGDNLGLFLGAGSGDAILNWNGTAFEIDFAIGDDLRIASTAGEHTITSSATGAELRFGQRLFAFGQTGAIGNQHWIFTAQAHTMPVAGEYSFGLFTQSANLTVPFANSNVYSFTYNAPSITLSGPGSVDTAGVLNVGGNPSHGTVNRFGIRILSNPAGGSGVNAALWVVAGNTELGGPITHTGSTLGFYSATPVVQPTAGGITAGFTAGVGTGVNDDSTFTGNTGASAYTIGDVVRALKDVGLLAA